MRLMKRVHSIEFPILSVHGGKGLPALTHAGGLNLVPEGVELTGDFDHFNE